MIKLPNTLSFRLTFWYAVTFIGLLLIAVLVLYFSAQAILDIRIDEDLREDVEEFSVLMKTGGLEQVYEEIRREEASSDNEEFFIQVLDSSGQVLHTTDLTDWQGLHVDKQLLERALTDAKESALTTLSLDSQDEDVRVAYGQIAADTILHIGESTEEKEEILEIILIVFCVMLLIVIPLASLIGWFIAKQAVHGIEQVSLAARDIEQGNLSCEVDVQGQRDEIQTLANTFNAMTKRISKLITEMREMIDNIAHDLRSPLGRIRAISERSLSSATTHEEFQSAAADTLEECDRLIQLINTTLDVAEAEAGIAHAAKEVIDLSALVADACELFAPAAEQKQITLSSQLDTGCQFKGEKSSLQRMLSNLLDNAIKYSSANGQISVQLKNSPSHIDIAVSDNGMGIPVADQQRIFDRFFRCDSSRSMDGCGLGLSFARAVARSHGGKISLQSEPSQGSTFVISLPLKMSSL